MFAVVRLKVLFHLGRSEYPDATLVPAGSLERLRPTQWNLTIIHFINCACIIETIVSVAAVKSCASIDKTA